MLLVIAPKVRAQDESFVEVNFANTYFTSSNTEYFGSDLKARNLPVVGLSYLRKKSQGTRESVLDVSMFYSGSEDAAYINLPEAYYDFGELNEDLALGRRRYTWSLADEFWQTGFWQPQFAWDRMRPEQLGFVGGFWSSDLTPTNRLKVFVSPIFVPDDRTRYRESNGQLLSKNPWFRGPPLRAPVLGVETDVFANIKVPDTSDVLLNPGAGFRWEHDLTPRQTLGLAYAYKPINQILNAFDYKLRTGSGVDLTFHPWVGYHALATLDWSFSTDRSLHHLSLTHENPSQLLSNPDFNYQRLTESLVASWISRWNLAGEGATASQLYVGYMRHWGGRIDDGGDALSDGTQFETRNFYFSVARLGFRHPVWTKARTLFNSIEVNYDALLRGGTVLSQLEYGFSDAWVVTFNMDLIGVFQTVEPQYQNNWINTYRANDKATLGLTYVY
jgi:hypothetical protein